MIHVLVVDDEFIIRTSLTKRIEEIANTIVVSGAAADGQEALDWLKHNYADLCVTDIRMPIKDGLELIKEINAQYPWMSSIIISSHDDFYFAQRGLQLGAIDYLLKPIDEMRLGESISHAISNIQSKRDQLAQKLLIDRLPQSRDMLDRWIEQIRTVHVETMPMLLMETLEMLELWVDGEYHLLNALSMAWLQLIIDSIRTERVSFVLEEGKDLGLGERLIKNDKRRMYFRLCAVRRLEEGAHVILKVMMKLQDSQSLKVIDKIKQYLHSHYDKKVALQDVADYVAMSRSHIVNLYKQETGTTIIHELIAIRMHKARELLFETELKMYEIAGHVGYDNAMHFSQVFKEHYGLSPMEYKKRMIS
ncbi:response regulator [Paenibacillus sp. CMAA1364]